MKLTAKLKLLPTPEQHHALLQTLETANQACNAISQQAWARQTFRRVPLHHLVYRQTRERFGPSAQMVVRQIAKVADSYRAHRHGQHTFSPHGAIAYDADGYIGRILSWRVEDQEVSIWTVDGRQRIPFACGAHQRALLGSRRGESDLCLVEGVFYLCATCEVGTPPVGEVEDYLGVDLGIVNLATDSDGEVFCGRRLNAVRRRHARLRRKLQRKGSKSAKRLLRKRRRKERRFARDVNHCIAIGCTAYTLCGASARLVAKAQGTARGIALEELGGIRERVTVAQRQRRRHHSWAFDDLRPAGTAGRPKIVYKAERAGVQVRVVDPRYTSRQCPVCGCRDKRNRRTQSEFSCVACGHSGYADHVAAVNIGRRAVVNQPDVSDRVTQGQAPPQAVG